MTNEDREKMKLIRNRIELQIPMTQIASELGEDIDALCKWIMDYKESNGRMTMWSQTESRLRKAIQDKARQGARAALERTG